MTDMKKALKAAESALEPFSTAWEVATAHDAVVTHLTMGRLGALAAHEVSGVHFRNALLAIEIVRGALKDTGIAWTDEQRIARGLDPAGGFDGPTGAE